jgi:transposase
MNRTLGMTESQFRYLVDLVAQAAPEKITTIGRPQKLSPAQKVRITVLYLRTNNTQEFLAAMFAVSQPVVSRTIAAVTTTLAWLLQIYVPDPEQASRGTTLLLDGTLAPCWTWADMPQLYSGKHKATGHNLQVASDLAGRLVYLSPPLPGSTHDAAAFRHHDLPNLLTSIAIGNSIGDKGYQGCGIITPRKKRIGRELTEHDKAANKPIHQRRATIERVIANIKTWRILHTDYRRPQHTFTTSLDAIRGLIFFQRGTTTL